MKNKKKYKTISLFLLLFLCCSCAMNDEKYKFGNISFYIPGEFIYQKKNFSDEYVELYSEEEDITIACLRSTDNRNIQNRDELNDIFLEMTGHLEKLQDKSLSFEIKEKENNRVILSRTFIQNDVNAHYDELIVLYNNGNAIWTLSYKFRHKQDSKFMSRVLKMAHRIR